MSSDRNRKRKYWAARKKPPRENVPPKGSLAIPPAPHDFGLERAVRRALADHTPSELDQIAWLITEQQLGLPVSSLDAIRGKAAALPFEPAVSLVAQLAARVEPILNRPKDQLALAREFFGPSELVSHYEAIVADHPNARVFGPQSLYALMRILIEDAYDAPIEQELTDQERIDLLTVVAASNSITERGIDFSVGENLDDLLAYEMQAGGYYSRPQWMEEMARHRELYRLATEDPQLMALPDFEPVRDWIERSGLTAHEQWELGFALGSVANAWDPTKHPHVPPATVADMLTKLQLADRHGEAIAVIAADRHEFKSDFDDLQADGHRFIWELRPFNTRPFLRLGKDRGLLLLGRPWVVSWLGEGFHYRALRQAQADDAAQADGRKNHVQNYTAYAGHVFEQYCLRLARDSISAPDKVIGEQAYGRRGASKTSDVTIASGADLVVFEANARRVGAEPLVGGDPFSATNELTRLVVKKIDQLGVAIGAVLDGQAELPDVQIDDVQRIFPVVVAAGHLWQTRTLWGYLDSARGKEKARGLQDERVQPLQLLDAADYETLLALATNGSRIPDLLARKTSGAYRTRDLAVWLAQDKQAPDHNVRLPMIELIWQSMVAGLEPKLTTPTPPV